MLEDVNIIGPYLKDYHFSLFCLRLLRIFNIMEINDSLNYIADDVFKSGLMMFMFRLLSIICVILCVAHVGGCIWFKLGEHYVRYILFNNCWTFLAKSDSIRGVAICEVWRISKWWRVFCSLYYVSLLVGNHSYNYWLWWYVSHIKRRNRLCHLLYGHRWIRLCLRYGSNGWHHPRLLSAKPSLRRCHARTKAVHGWEMHQGRPATTGNKVRCLHVPHIELQQLEWRLVAWSADSGYQGTGEEVVVFWCSESDEVF